jgi:hypothetical protein
MTAVLGKFEKQTAEVIDYYVLFADWFSNRTDAIASINVTADPGITVTTSSFTGTSVKIVLTGGTNGTKYKITARVTTTSTPAIVKEADFTVTIKDV